MKAYTHNGTYSWEAEVARVAATILSSRFRDVEIIQTPEAVRFVVTVRTPKERGIGGV